MPLLPPIDLVGFVRDNRHLLKPPVGNRMVWQDTQFLVMVVGGPNQRKDYHVEDGEELFYQIEGDITLAVIEDGKKRDIPIRQGELFLLPGGVPHSPQRPAGTVGLVVERKRLPGEIDHLRWYCDACDALLHDDAFAMVDLGKQLKPLIEAFFADEVRRTCKQCGAVMPVPQR